MRPDDVVFACDGELVSLRTVLAAALVSGGLVPVIERLAGALALQARNGRSGRPATPGRGFDAGAAAAAWRRAHALTDDSDFAQWLTAHGLAARHLRAHLYRRHLAASDTAGPARATERARTRALRLLHAEAAFADLIPAAITAVAPRWALPVGADPLPADAIAAAGSAVADLGGGARVARALGLDERALAALIRREARCRRALSDLAGPAALARALASYRIALTRITLRQLQFDRHADAALFASVAAARSPAAAAALVEPHAEQTDRIWVEDITGGRDGEAVAAAPAGAVLRPDPADGRHLVRIVVDRRPPSLDDDATVRRLREHLLADRCRLHLRRRVAWRF